MQFDRPLGASEFRPVVHRQAQIDDRRVEADQFILEAELLFTGSFCRYGTVQVIKDLLEQFPRAVAVGVGQG